MEENTIPTLELKETKKNTTLQYATLAYLLRKLKSSGDVYVLFLNLSYLYLSLSRF